MGESSTAQTQNDELSMDSMEVQSPSQTPILFLNTEPPTIGSSQASDIERPTTISQLLHSRGTAQVPEQQQEAEDNENLHVIENREVENVVDVPQIVLWELEHTFNNEAEFQEFMKTKEEGIWTSGKKDNLKRGVKETFRCSKMKQRGQQCAAGLYTLSGIEPGCTKIQVFRKNIPHNHD